ncbi:MAG: hypothetical protein KDB02_12650 [Acidimicrobiales bacterium]|nr:hypothetical protein [Acidimicrobiales bacterium]
MTADIEDDDARERADEAGTDPRVEQGVEHLQRAAREMIAASRAFLDVVEELVERPEGVREVLGAVSSLGDVAGLAMRQARRSAPGREPSHDDGDDEPPVQRIPVS